MKTKEYMRLARISLKSRKKTTRSTVLGITFGLIMLVPILFLGLGLSGDLQKQINKNPHLIYANVAYAKSEYKLEDSVRSQEHNNETGENKSYEQLVGSNHQADFDALDKEKIFYTALVNSNINFTHQYGDSNDSPKMSGTSVSVDGGPSTEVSDTSGLGANLSLTSVVDLQKNPSFIPSNIKDAYVDGMNGGFVGDGKEQVIISEAFAKTIGKTAAELYGKYLTVTYNDKTSGRSSGWGDGVYPGEYYNASVRTDNDNDPNNEYDQNAGSRNNDKTFFSNYKIVGVLAEKYNSMYYNGDHILASAMILSKSSVYAPDGKCIKPTFRYTQDGTRVSAVATYVFSDAELDAMKRYVTMGVYANTCIAKSTTKTATYFYELENVLLVAKNYNDLNSTIKDISGKFAGTYEDKALSSFIKQYASETFNSYNMIYTIFMYVALVLSTVGGIVFFSAMVNLFNTIMHSVGSRKNYLGVMRAIGAEDNVIPKLYVFETLAIFARALLWVLLFGGGICVGIKIGIDFMFKYVGTALGLTLSIGWGYIAIVFAIVVAVLLFFGWLFAFACSYRVAKQPITEVLEG